MPFVIITISYVLIINAFGKSSNELKRAACIISKDASEAQSSTPKSADAVRLQSSNMRHLIRWQRNSSRNQNQALSESTEVKKPSMTLFSFENMDAHQMISNKTSAGSGSIRRVASCSLLGENSEESNQSSYNIKSNLPLPCDRALLAARAELPRQPRLPEILRSKTLDNFPTTGYGASQSARLTRMARNSQARSAFFPEDASSSSSKRNSARLNSHSIRTMLQFRLAKMSFYLILLWLVSWTPIASLAMINSVVSCHHASATAVFMASTMTKLGPTFDVFIYGISHPRLRSKFRQIIKWLVMFGNSAQTHNNHEYWSAFFKIERAKGRPIYKQDSIKSNM